MTNNKRKTMTVIIAILTLIILILPTISCATISADNFKPSNPSKSDVDKITNLANPIIGTLKVTGIVIAVIILTIIGIKFMTGSIEEKAEYKKTLPAYFIGAIIVVAISQILAIIIEIVTNVK